MTEVEAGRQRLTDSPGYLKSWALGESPILWTRPWATGRLDSELDAMFHPVTGSSENQPMYTGGETSCIEVV